MSMHFRRMSDDLRQKWGFGDETEARMGPPHCMVDGLKATFLLSPEKGLIIIIHHFSKPDEVWRGPVGLRSYQIVIELPHHTSRKAMTEWGMVKDEPDKTIENRFE
jgi:hypothetical protein